MPPTYLFVSVIIPSYNSKLHIPKCLAAVTSQNYPQEQFEIIVVDDGSTDGSDEMVSSYSVKLIKQSNQGPSAARNRGLKEAKGTLILFLDADCVVREDWITSHVHSHAQLHALQKIPACIGGSILPHKEGLNFIELCDYYASWYLPPHASGKREEYEYLPTTNLSVKKDMLDQVGGLDESLQCGEDIDLGIKLREKGYTIVRRPDIPCYHIGRKTFRGFLQHHYHWGRFAPFFRPYGSKARYNFLFPPNLLLAVIISPFIAVGYTAYVIAKWLFQKPAVILALSPMIFLSKIAYAFGCVRGTADLLRQRSIGPVHNAAT